MSYHRTHRLAVAAIPVLIAGVVLAASCLYTQDVGEVVVLRSWGGAIAGHSEDAGFHLKAPWQTSIRYDVRNNLISLYRDSDYTADGGSAEGKTVTVNDKSGASADVDLQVIYSLKPSAAEDLYRDYGRQDTFTRDYLVNDLRSVAREQAGSYDTLTMLTDRSKYTDGMRRALTDRWGGLGVTVEQVSVQDVRYPDAITGAYNDAQAAEVARRKAENEQETARVEAETRKIKAQGEADANAVLNQSLTDRILQREYIDALKNADRLIVTPDGTGTLLQAD